MLHTYLGRQEPNHTAAPNGTRDDDEQSQTIAYYVYGDTMQCLYLCRPGSAKNKKRPRLRTTTWYCRCSHGGGWFHIRPISTINCRLAPDTRLLP